MSHSEALGAIAPVSSRRGADLDQTAPGDPVPPSGPVSTPLGIPEFLMGMSAIEFHGDQASAFVEVGPWLTWGGAFAVAGSFGVLFDSVLAHAIMRGASTPTGMVSTEITIDLLAPILINEQERLWARAIPRQRDAVSGFGTAELRTSSGALLALATQRGRLMPPIDWPAPDCDGMVGRSANSTLADILAPDGRAPLMTDAGRVAVQVDARSGNHMNNMHGGVSLLVAEWCALSAVTARGGGGLSTVSIRVSYARPIPVGSTLILETTVHHLGRTTANVGVVGLTESGSTALVAGIPLHQA